MCIRDSLIAESDRGLGALQDGGARAVLRVNDHGEDDVLARVLRAAKLPVKTVAPEGARLDPLALLDRLDVDAPGAPPLSPERVASLSKAPDTEGELGPMEAAPDEAAEAE